MKTLVERLQQGCGDVVRDHALMQEAAAALLAAEAMAEAIQAADDQNFQCPVEDDRMRAALAAYRSATGRASE